MKVVAAWAAGSQGCWEPPEEPRRGRLVPQKHERLGTDLPMPSHHRLRAAWHHDELRP